METVKTFNELITPVQNQKNALVLVLAASRETDGVRVPITDAQKDAAMNAAKAVLQCVGADTEAQSCAMLFPDVELQEGEKLTLRVAATLERQSEKE